MSEHTGQLRIADIPETLRHLTLHYANLLHQISEDTFSAKETPSRWSKKEILGHLIDSAHNNLRRFIMTQYELHPPHIVYDQDFWVKANNYQQAPVQELILLWRSLNDRIATVLQNMPAVHFESLCNTGKGQDDLHALSFVANDYVAHLKHHLEQLLN